MANKYGNIQDERFFDVSVPQKFLDDSQEYAGAIQDDPIGDYFKGENTKEFYCGMIAAFRAASSIIRSVPDKEQADDLITAASLYSTVLAKENKR